MSILSIFAGFLIIVLGIIIIFGFFEVMLRCISWFKREFLIREVSRSNFLADEYQDYLQRVEDWSKPMFFYFPVGFRLFNLDNPIPERVNNNSLGFRCPEFIPPDKHTKRIVLLGGSAAWGSGSTDNSTTIAGYIEKYFNEDKKLLGPYKKAECFNLAQLNGTQTQDILSLTFFCNQIQPDLILSFTGWNELVTSHSFNETLLKKFNMFYIKEMEGWEPLNVVGNKTKLLKESLSLWMNEHFELARYLNSGKKPSNKKDLNYSEIIENRSNLFKSQLKILNTICRAFNAQHIQFLQPYLYRKKNLTEQEKKIVHLYDDLRPVHGGKILGDFLRNNNIYDYMKEDLLSNPDDYGPVHDLCDMFRNEKETRFFTLVHLKDSGYHDTAKKMISLL